MNGFRDQFLSRPALTLNQHRGGAVRDQADHVEELLHGRASADQPSQGLSHRRRRVLGRLHHRLGQLLDVLVRKQHQHDTDLALLSDQRKGLIHAACSTVSKACTGD